jgi:2-polyprenyl-3-methyl-5-hydroxy-6-metoxy-1,4-benzoquinol methylase
MRTIDCPICGDPTKRVVYETTLPRDFDERRPPSPYSARYRINECEGCGLIHSSPVMEEAGVAALYEQSSEANVEAGEEDNVRRTMAGYYRLAVPRLLARDRVLDVGCDMGFMLEAARADGFKELHGLEPVPVAREIAMQLDGANISAEFFEDTSYPRDYFDLITFVHVLDHLYDPRHVLRRAHGNLRPGGLVLAVVHNVDSLLHRMLGGRFPIFNLYHHYFFNKKSLADMFRSQGFEVVDVVSTRNCYSLGFFAKRLPGVNDTVRRALHGSLRTLGLSDLPINIPVGNIAVVARRSLSSTGAT